jgi:hypothetical protein
MTFLAGSRSVADMATHTNDDTSDETTDAESAFIGPALRQLESELGMDRPQLCRFLGVSYSHYNNLLNDLRPAGLRTVAKIAKRSGRTFGFFLGDFEALPQIGTVSAQGLVRMTTTTSHPPGLIRCHDSLPGMASGTLLHLYPGGYEPDRWLVIRVADDQDPWLMWGWEENGVRFLDRVNGETVVLNETLHKVLGRVMLETKEPANPRRRAVSP